MAKGTASKSDAAKGENIGAVRCDRPQNGTEYLESLRDGREVYIYGERVDDVTTHPAFRNTARMTARLFDALHDKEKSKKLLLPSDTDGKGMTHAFFKAAARETQEARGDALAALARWTPELEASWLGDGCDALAWAPAGPDGTEDLACAHADAVQILPGGGGPELRRTTGISGTARTVAVAVDGSIAVGTERGWVQRWDPAGKRVLDSVLEGAVDALAFGPDGALYAGDSAELVRFEPDGTATRRRTVGAPVGAVALRPEGLWITTGSELVRVEPATLAILEVRAGPGPRLHGAAFAEGAVVVAAVDGTAAVADGPGWRRIGGEGGSGRVAFGVGGRIVDMRESGRVRFLDPQGTALAELPGARRPSAVALSASGARLAAATPGQGITLWSLSGPPDPAPARFRAAAAPDAVEVLADGSVVVVSGSRVEGWSREGRLAWEREGEWLGAREGVDLGPHRAAVALPDGRVFALAETDAFVVNPAVSALPNARYTVTPAWVVAGVEEVAIEHPDGLGILRLGTGAVEVVDVPASAAVRRSRDGAVLAVPDPDLGTVDLVDLGEGKVRAQIALPPPLGEIGLGPGGTLLAAVVGPDRHLALVDTRDGRVLALLGADPAPVVSLAFDPEARWLVSASGDGAVASYDLRGLLLAGEGLVEQVHDRFGVRLVDGRMVTTAP